MTQFRLTTLSSLVLLLLASNQNVVVNADEEEIDHTCFFQRDYRSTNKCQTIGDGICDDPNLGGSGGDDCLNQDCLDCNYHCRAFDNDCRGCISAKGCFYCPEDGTCENSSDYKSSNKVQQCTLREDYLGSLNGNTPDSCLDGAVTKDPQFAGSNWMFEMINLLPVWETYQLYGKGITIRINDDGVYVDNKEFTDRFDKDNSCPLYLPDLENPDENDHGTAVAGIIVGNANNDLCAVGIAHEARFSACNFFVENFGSNQDYGALAYKLDSFDISQNSIGIPGCKETGDLSELDNVIHDVGCPFTFDSKYDPCGNCEGQFTADRTLTPLCVDAITKHCKNHYKEDTEACTDFPELIIGGPCDYDKMPSSAATSFELGIKNGRGGKGTIFTFAAGNSFTEGDDVNFGGWTNSRYTITVGAVGKNGKHAAYSTPGAALVVSAPAGDDADIGHLQTAGMGVETCADSGQGTSFACPVVSAVIALILEANPELSWRDVQGILAETSTNVPDDTEDDTQTTNGAGIWHSSWYGFGIVNAMGAVEAAMNWNLFAEELQAVGISKQENKELSDNNGNQFTSTIDMDPAGDNYPDDFVAESTVVLIDLSHYNRGDLEIELESPSGTISILVPGKRPENNEKQAEERWKLMTLKNWGEDPTGTWKLTVRDLVDRVDSADKNVFRNWQMIIYGHSASGKSGFSVVDNSEGPLTSQFCLDPNAPNEGCAIDLNGDLSCPMGFSFSAGDQSLILDAKLNCPNDLLISQGLDATDASQMGLCSCDAATFDESCDVIEEDLECQCFACTNGGMSFSCNKPIILDCKSLDCDGTCNGAFEFPLKDDIPVTGPPTRNPTSSPTEPPTKKNSTEPPTRNPTSSPTEPPTKKDSTEPPTRNPTSSPTLPPSKSPVAPTIPTLAPTKITSVIDDEDLIAKPTLAPTDTPDVFPTPAPTKTEGDLKDERNLSCENAVSISSSTTPVEGALSSVPVIGLEGPCLSGLETVGGWYQVVGNGNIFTLTACSLEASKSVGISVFTGSCGKSECIEHQSRQIAACENGNGHALSFTTEAGKGYNVLISGIPVGSPLPGSTDGSTSSEKERRHLEPTATDFRLTLTESETPPNGKCGSAFPANFDKSVKGNTLGLLTTFQTCQNNDKPGSWYTIEGGTPEKEDSVIVYEANTCNQESNFFNTMSVFRGDGCGDHECVEVDRLPCPSGWFGEQIFWSVTGIKENYQVFVHSSDTIEAQTYNAGSFQMDMSYYERLQNDQCNAALSVEINREESVRSTTRGAKPDISAIDGSTCGMGGAGAWYRVRGTGGVLQASTCASGTDFKSSIQVYSGQCGFLKCVDFAAGNKALCDDGKGSVVNFKTQEGIIYFILVTGRREGQSGIFRLQVTDQDAEKNNECSEAIPLTNGTSVDGSTLQATVDFPQGESCVVPLDTPGVWYTIEGTGKAIEVSTCQNNDFDSAISIFKGTCPISLECVAGSSATDPKCTNGNGVTTSFYGEKGTTYHVYVHGAAGSSNHMGDFTLSYSEFDVTEQNEFCPKALEISSDGSRVQGSTQDATHASIPVSSCGVEITKPGLWYSVKGNGQPLQITACSDDYDEGGFDVSVSVFEGGAGGCDSLTCVSGTTFVEKCATGQGRRSLQYSLTSSALRFMSKPKTDYFIFVHGTDVGDFDMFVRDENIEGFGTEAPTATPIRHGKDLFRWIPVNTRALVIPTDYLDLEILYQPVLGNASIAGYQIKYTPPADFVGDDVMTVIGCNDGDCYMFEINVHVMGDKPEPASAKGEGFNKLWLLFLLLLVIIPLICLPFILFCKRRRDQKQNNNIQDDDDYSDGFDNDPFDRNPNQMSSRRGMNDSSGDDWESSDDDDDDGSYDSRDQESESDSDDDNRRNESSVDESDDSFVAGFGGDGFKDESSNGSSSARFYPA